MTAEPHTTRDRVDDDHDHDHHNDHHSDHDGAVHREDRRPDLSAAFGPPAAASLRGLLPPRPRRSTEQTGEQTGEQPTEEPPAPVDETSAVATDAPTELAEPAEPAAPEVAEVPAPRRRTAAPRPARATSAGTAGTAAGASNRRWGTARLASREHVELLVLAALRDGPADGRELVERLRTGSGGGLAPPPTTVQRTLHHLLRRGLVERVPDPERRRLQLSEAGTRVLRARVRAWRALRRAVDAVLDAADVD